MGRVKCVKCCFRAKKHCNRWNIRIDNIYQDDCPDGIDLSQFGGGDSDELP